MTPDNITTDRVRDFYTKLEIAYLSMCDLHRQIRNSRIGPHEAASDINETLAELARAAGFDVEFTRSGMTLTNQP